jgi:hypothetical protein
MARRQDPVIGKVTLAGAPRKGYRKTSGRPVGKQLLVSRAHAAKTAAQLDAPNMPPQWVLDELAERKLTGGFNVRPSNLCYGCRTYRSVNGTCGCTDGQATPQRTHMGALGVAGPATSGAAPVERGAGRVRRTRSAPRGQRVVVVSWEAPERTARKPADPGLRRRSR